MAVNPSVILVVMSLFISAAAIASLIKWPPSGIASRLVYYYSVIHCLFTAVFIPLVRLLYPDTPPMSAGVAVCSILLLTGVYGVMFAIGQCCFTNTIHDWRPNHSWHNVARLEVGHCGWYGWDHLSPCNYLLWRWWWRGSVLGWCQALERCVHRDRCKSTLYSDNMYTYSALVL